MLFSLLVFVLILGLLIFVHEFGHFLLAKLSGVEVQEFAFGFPPRILSKKIGETRYSINLIPLGGYVKLLGEEGENQSKKSFSQKPATTRLAIIIAGVLMNFILAWGLLVVGFKIGMTPLALDPEKLGGKKSSEILVVSVDPNSPAFEAGIKPGDFVKFEGKVEDFQQLTKEHIGQPLSLTLKREDKAFEVTATPKDPKEGAAPLGIGITQVVAVKLGLGGALRAATLEMWEVTKLIFNFLGTLGRDLFKEARVPEGVYGPVGIYAITREAVNLGFVYVLQLTALLSLNLGFINALPFPALDGGRLIFVLTEGILRRRVFRQELENALHNIGFAFLILLMLAVTFKDLMRFFGG